MMDTLSRAQLRSIIADVCELADTSPEYAAKMVAWAEEATEFGSNFQSVPACPAAQAGFWLPSDDDLALERHRAAVDWAYAFDDILFARGLTHRFYRVTE